MKHYYYADNSQQLGPFTFEELKSKRIKKSTLVWTEGMENWMVASEVSELKNIIISEPPPLPQIKANDFPTENIQSKHSPKPQNIFYDLTYKKETEATFLGVLVIIIPLLLKFSGLFKYENEESYNNATIFFTIGTLIVRVFTAIYIVGIASRQNRNTTAWLWFGFFLPSIALIVIGQLRKLRLKITLDDNIPKSQQAIILCQKAKQFFDDNRYAECIEILDKAIEIDNQNFSAIELRGLAHYKTKAYQNSKQDFEQLIEKGKQLSVSNFYLGNIAQSDNNIELAISFWLKADELKNGFAKIKLDQYHTFRGIYILEESEAKRKLNFNSEGHFIYFSNGKYIRGISMIDETEKLGSLRTYLSGYSQGLYIQLKRTFKTYHLAISYHEIDNIKYDDSVKLIELHLIDKKNLIFRYDYNKDYNKGLKKLCERFNQKTGKIADATDALNN